MAHTDIPAAAAALRNRDVTFLGSDHKRSRGDISAAPTGSYLVSHIILALLECQP